MDALGEALDAESDEAPSICSAGNWLSKKIDEFTLELP
jgi:hypothetical protein